MNSTGKHIPGADEIRAYHLERLNNVLRRPGMWGGEITIRLFMDDVAFVTGTTEEWQKEREDLQQRGAFSPHGVEGAFALLFPDYGPKLSWEGAAASVYAEIAWRHGWLSVDRYLPDDTVRELRTDCTRWKEHDYCLADIEAELGPPSVLHGGGNPRFDMTLTYAPSTPGQDIVCFDFAGDDQLRSPMLAVRSGTGPFAESFIFTPAGTRILFPR